MHAASCLSRRALSSCHRRLLAGGPAVVHADAPAVPVLEVRPTRVAPLVQRQWPWRQAPYLVISRACSSAALLKMASGLLRSMTVRLSSMTACQHGIMGCCSVRTAICDVILARFLEHQHSCHDRSLSPLSYCAEHDHMLRRMHVVILASASSPCAAPGTATCTSWCVGAACR